MKYLIMKELKVKIKSLNLNSKSGKEVMLDENLFGISPRPDIMARGVRWQLAKRRLVNHSVKTRGEIKMTTAKMYKQKGTGKASYFPGICYFSLTVWMCVVLTKGNRVYM